MGIMTFLRNRAGTVMVFAIGFAIVAFLLGDLMGSGVTIFGKNPNEIGQIDGESIDYQDFNSEVEANKNNMAQQMGGKYKSSNDDLYCRKCLEPKYFKKAIE